MATVLINDSSLTSMADAIREKLDVETTYLPSQMAAAIGSIETGGTDITSADAGKVVVEDAGSYVLAAQTSRSISQNGTYDTTTNNEVVVNVQGGGGGNVIRGSGAPTSDIGSDGDVYLEGRPYISLSDSGNNDKTYINTGIKPKLDWGLEISVYVPGSNMFASYNTLFSAPVSSSGSLQIYMNKNKVINFAANNYTASSGVTVSEFQYGKDAVFVVSNHALSIVQDGQTLQVKTDGSGSDVAKSNLLLFNGVDSYLQQFRGNVYYAKIFDSNGDLVMHLTPHQNGMYDLVSDTVYSFSTNKWAYNSGNVVAAYYKSNGAWTQIVS